MMATVGCAGGAEGNDEPEGIKVFVGDALPESGAKPIPPLVRNPTGLAAHLQVVRQDGVPWGMHKRRPAHVQELPSEDVAAEEVRNVISPEDPVDVFDEGVFWNDEMEHFVGRRH